MTADSDYNYSTVSESDYLSRGYHWSSRIEYICSLLQLFLCHQLREYAMIIFSCYQAIQLITNYCYRPYYVRFIDFTNIIVIVLQLTSVIMMQVFTQIKVYAILSLCPIVIYFLLAFKNNTQMKDIQLLSYAIKKLLINNTNNNNRGNFKIASESVLWRCIDRVYRFDYLSTINRYCYYHHIIYLFSLIQVILQPQQEQHQHQQSLVFQSNDNINSKSNENNQKERDEELRKKIYQYLMYLFKDYILNKNNLDWSNQHKSKSSNSLIYSYVSYFVLLIEKRNNLVLYSLEIEELKRNMELSMKHKQIFHTLHELFHKKKKNMKLAIDCRNKNENKQNENNIFSSRSNDILNFESDMIHLKKRIDEAIASKLDLFNILTLKVIQNKQLISALTVIHDKISLIQDLLRKMLLNQFNHLQFYQLLNIYFKYLSFNSQDLPHYTYAGESIVSMNKESDIKEYSNKKKVCVVVAVREKQSWIIKKVSSNFSDFMMIGQQQSGKMLSTHNLQIPNSKLSANNLKQIAHTNIIDKDIIFLMPFCFRQYHYKYVEDFLEQDSSDLIHINHESRVLYAKSGKGYILPLRLEIRVNNINIQQNNVKSNEQILPQKESNTEKEVSCFSLVAEFTEIGQDMQVIMYDSNTLDVIGFTENLAFTLAKNINLDNICKIFPFMKRRNALNQIDKETIKNRLEEKQAIIKLKSYSLQKQRTKKTGKQYQDNDKDLTQSRENEFKIKYLLDKNEEKDANIKEEMFWFEKREYLIIKRKNPNNGNSSKSKRKQFQNNPIEEQQSNFTIDSDSKSIKKIDPQDYYFYKKQGTLRANQFTLHSYAFQLCELELNNHQYRYHPDIGIVNISNVQILHTSSDANKILQFIKKAFFHYEEILGREEVRSLTSSLQFFTSRYNDAVPSKSNISESCQQYEESLQTNFKQVGQSKELPNNNDLLKDFSISLQINQQEDNGSNKGLQTSKAPVALESARIHLEESDRINHLVSTDRIRLIDKIYNNDVQNTAQIPEEEVKQLEKELCSSVDSVIEDKFKSVLSQDKLIKSNLSQSPRQLLQQQLSFSNIYDSHENGIYSFTSATSPFTNQQPQQQQQLQYQQDNKMQITQNNNNKSNFNPSGDSNLNNNPMKQSQSPSYKNRNQESIFKVSSREIKLNGSNVENNKIVSPSMKDVVKQSKLIKYKSMKKDQPSFEENLNVKFSKNLSSQKFKKELKQEYQLKKKQKSNRDKGNDVTIGSSEASFVSGKKQLIQFLNSKKGLFKVKLISYVGLLSFAALVASAINQYVLTSYQINYNYEEWQNFDWPSVYQQDLFIMMKQMNIITFLNRTDNVFYFPITASQSKELLNEANIESWGMKTKNMNLLGYMSRVGVKQKVFQLILEKPAGYTIGLIYNTSIIHGTPSAPVDIIGTYYPASLFYSLILSQYHTYRFAAQLANGRPEYFTYINQVNLSKFLVNIYSQILAQEEELKSSIDSQLSMILILVIAISIVSLLAVLPLYSFVQNRRDRILFLFGTFYSNQLDPLKYELQDYLANCQQLGEKQGQNKQIVYPNLKSNNNNNSKHSISYITPLLKLNPFIMLLLLIVFILIISSPIIIKLETSAYLVQAIKDFNAEYMVNQVQAHILEMVGINYFCIVLKLYPKTKMVNLSSFLINSQNVIAKGPEMMGILDQLGQSQNQETRFEFIFLHLIEILIVHRYHQEAFDNFFFGILKDSIIKKLEENPQYWRNSTSNTTIQQCENIQQRYLQNGLQLAYSSYLTYYDSIYSLISSTDNSQTATLLAKLKVNFKLYDFTIYSKCLAEAANSLTIFLKEIHRSYYNFIQLLQLILFILQLTILSILYLIGWKKFANFLLMSIHQTQQLLKVLNVNTLLDNSYIVSFMRNNKSL